MRGASAETPKPTTSATIAWASSMEIGETDAGGWRRQRRKRVIVEIADDATQSRVVEDERLWQLGHADAL